MLGSSSCATAATELSSGAQRGQRDGVDPVEAAARRCPGRPRRRGLLVDDAAGDPAEHPTTRASAATPARPSRDPAAAAGAAGRAARVGEPLGRRRPGARAGSGVGPWAAGVRGRSAVGAAGADGARRVVSSAPPAEGGTRRGRERLASCRRPGGSRAARRSSRRHQSCPGRRGTAVARGPAIAVADSAPRAAAGGRGSTRPASALAGGRGWSSEVTGARRSRCGASAGAAPSARTPITAAPTAPPPRAASPTARRGAGGRLEDAGRREVRLEAQERRGAPGSGPRSSEPLRSAPARRRRVAMARGRRGGS